MPASKYKPIMCKRVKDYLAQGYSKRATAGLLGVNADTLFEWVKVHPEFAEAVSVGSQMGEARYTKLMMNMSEGAKGSPQAAIFMMKNLYRYSDNNVEETENKPIQIQFIVDKPKGSNDND